MSQKLIKDSQQSSYNNQAKSNNKNDGFSNKKNQQMRQVEVDNEEEEEDNSSFDFIDTNKSGQYKESKSQIMASFLSKTGGKEDEQADFDYTKSIAPNKNKKGPAFNNEISRGANSMSTSYNKPYQQRRPSPDKNLHCLEQTIGSKHSNERQDGYKNMPKTNNSNQKQNKGQNGGIVLGEFNFKQKDNSKQENAQKTYKNDNNYDEFGMDFQHEFDFSGELSEDEKFEQNNSIFHTEFGKTNNDKNQNTKYVNSLRGKNNKSSGNQDNHFFDKFEDM